MIGLDLTNHEERGTISGDRGAALAPAPTSRPIEQVHHERLAPAGDSARSPAPRVDFQPDREGADGDDDDGQQGGESHGGSPRAEKRGAGFYQTAPAGRYSRRRGRVPTPRQGRSRTRKRRSSAVVGELLPGRPELSRFAWHDTQSVA